ncbi:LAME_0B03796g1_1 [Lachancea meyersii CBS 8951]|uniref:LAME_0B03796g1_1 n=1 Tax=Lachancea meyersii CBS 8951 TaxID=1266667 RepID=A0A1G4IUX0_9SACH|nr:LAME_0B03796g1_1 [Lachancea meyersii CBS 8951]
MSYNGNLGFDSLHQHSKNIPRPTSSGQILDQNARINGNADPARQLYSSNNQQAYYSNYATYGFSQGQPQMSYNAYHPYHNNPMQQQRSQAFYGAPPYYNQPAPAPAPYFHGLQGHQREQTPFFNAQVSYSTGHNETPKNDHTDEENRLEMKAPEKTNIDTKETVADCLSQKKKEETEKKSVAIQGTSITLESEHDIKQWREERRKMWLVKISNQREKHKADLGVEEVEPNNNLSFQSARKDKQFIQNIQNQISRYNPSPNLSLNLVQRTMAEENTSLLNFIKELGDAKLLEYELNEEEKEKLFGSGRRGRNKVDHNNNYNDNNTNKRTANSRHGPSRYEGNTKRQRVQEHNKGN